MAKDKIDRAWKKCSSCGYERLIAPVRDRCLCEGYLEDMGKPVVLGTLSKAKGGKE